MRRVGAVVTHLNERYWSLRNEVDAHPRRWFVETEPHELKRVRKPSTFLEGFQRPSIDNASGVAPDHGTAWSGRKLEARRRRPMSLLLRLREAAPDVGVATADVQAGGEHRRKSI